MEANFSNEWLILIQFHGGEEGLAWRGLMVCTLVHAMGHVDGGWMENWYTNIILMSVQSVFKSVFVRSWILCRIPYFACKEILFANGVRSLFESERCLFRIWVYQFSCFKKNHNRFFIAPFSTCENIFRQTSHKCSEIGPLGCYRSTSFEKWSFKIPKRFNDRDSQSLSTLTALPLPKITTILEMDTNTGNTHSPFGLWLGGVQMKCKWNDLWRWQ